MHTITLDASKWRTLGDFYDALLAALGAPEWHGRSVDGLIDSMIWGGINKLAPPYAVKVISTSDLPNDVSDTIKLYAAYLAKAREEYRIRQGEDVDVSLEVCP